MSEESCIQEFLESVLSQSFRERFYTKGKLFEMDVRKRLGEGQDNQESAPQESQGFQELQECQASGEAIEEGQASLEVQSGQAQEGQESSNQEPQELTTYVFQFEGWDFQIAKFLLDAIIQMCMNFKECQDSADGESCQGDGKCEDNDKSEKLGKTEGSDEGIDGDKESVSEGVDEDKKRVPEGIDEDKGGVPDVTQISFFPMAPQDIGDIPKSVLHKQIVTEICRKLVKPQSFYREVGVGAMRNKPLIAQHLAARQPQKLSEDTLRYKSFPVNFYFDIHQWGESSRAWQFKIMSELINSELTVYLGSTGYVSHILSVNKPVNLTVSQVGELYKAFQGARSGNKMLDFSMYGLRFKGLSDWMSLVDLIKLERILKLVVFTDYHSLEELSKIPEEVECYWVPGRCTVNCDQLRHNQPMRQAVAKSFKGVFIDAWDDKTLLGYLQKMQPIYKVERNKSIESLKK